MIGNFLCADKRDTLLRYILPVDKSGFMPAENELRQEMLLEDFVKMESELLDGSIIYETLSYFYSCYFYRKSITNPSDDNS
mgnify:FL=1